jgi:hypothetical protein
MSMTTILLFTGLLALYATCALGLFEVAQETHPPYPLDLFPEITAIVYATVALLWPLAMVGVLFFTGLDSLLGEGGEE